MGQSRVILRKFLVCLVACVGPLSVTAALVAQQKQAAPAAAKKPEITAVFPGGGQRGSSCEIQIKGKNLNTVTELYFSPPLGSVQHMEAKSAELLVATISVDKSAELGTAELRAWSYEGMSNLKLFRIDEFPEIVEKSQKNDSPDDAQEVSFPVVANGQLGNTDIDYYRLNVKKPQRLLLEVEARRIGSPAEVRLRLFDVNGRQLADAATTAETRPDERLDYDFTTPGDYLVAIEDAQYVGGDASIYRLRIGSWPYATSMFPLGGRRGESVEVTLDGGNLKKPATFRVDLPDQAEWIRPRFNTEAGTIVAPMWLAPGDLTEVHETEPNDLPPAPQSIQSPCVVNGRIDKPLDKDRFLLQAKKGEKYVVEVYADRLGSKLDSVLVVADKNGKQIAENDDLRAGNAQQNPQSKAGISPVSDSRLEFTAPADGNYLITLDDRYNSGGPEFAYRLVIDRAKPDFQVVYGAVPQKNQPQPKNQPPAGPSDVVNLEPGKSATVPVTVTRRGYDGEITLSVEGLPPGLSFESGKIAAKQPGGQVTIKADDDAQSCSGRIRVIGTATIDSQEVKRVVGNEVIVAAIDPLHTARLDMSDFALAVTRREAPLALKFEGDAVLARGLGGELKVSVDRKSGFKGPVEISLNKLPKGVAAEKTVIPEDQDDAIIKLSSSASTAIAKQKIQVVSKGKLGAATVEASAEVTLAVVLPFELTLDPKEKELELLAGEVCSLRIDVRRVGNFQGPIELAVTGLPAGVTVSPDKIDADQDEVELSFKVADEAKPFKGKKSIKVQATGAIGDQKVKFETAAIPLSFKTSR